MTKLNLCSLSCGVLLMMGSCDIVQTRNQEQNQTEQQTTPQTPPAPEPYVAPTVSSRHKVHARVWNWVNDGTIEGVCKLSHEYRELDLEIYDDNTMRCNGLPVRYSLFRDYDYECNHGNTGYAFNMSDVY